MNYAKLVSRRKRTLESDEGPSNKAPKTETSLPWERNEFIVKELQGSVDELQLELKKKEEMIKAIREERESESKIPVYIAKCDELERSKKELILEHNKEVTRLKFKCKKTDNLLSESNALLTTERIKHQKYKKCSDDEMSEKAIMLEKTVKEVS